MSSYLYFARGVPWEARSSDHLPRHGGKDFEGFLGMIDPTGQWSLQHTYKVSLYWNILNRCAGPQFEDFFPCPDDGLVHLEELMKLVPAFKRALPEMIRSAKRYGSYEEEIERFLLAFMASLERITLQRPDGRGWAIVMS